MNIRSLTGFLTFADPLAVSTLDPLRGLIDAARVDLPRAGLPLQTARVATQSITDLKPRDLTQFAQDLEAACKTSGIEYASLGAARADHPSASLDLVDAIPAALAATENAFAAVQMASYENGINLHAVHATARAIRTLADARPDGFGNFRLAALANCPPHSPFFPVAYHRGDEPAFAFAAEGAPLAVEAFTGAKNLDQARSDLIRSVESAAQSLARVGEDLAARFHFRFAGIDFSLAPFPEESLSIGTAIERLTGARFGEHGTLFAAAFITDCLNRAQFPRTGFSGLMLPVLEDSTLAARSTLYSLDSLLLYSTVCGTGLDTIPLPGDISADALAGILLDLATLAVKLNKPLTARLIPLGRLKAGDRTRFDFQYFANAHVLHPNASTLKFFASDAQIGFKPRDT